MSKERGFVIRRAVCHGEVFGHVAPWFIQTCWMKKVLSAGINGAAVRLFEATDELAISEGIETGQALAFALARRLKQAEKKTGRRQVQVFLPKQAGSDWADVWRQRLDTQAPRAA